MSRFSLEYCGTLKLGKSVNFECLHDLLILHFGGVSTVLAEFVYPRIRT